MVRKVSAFLLAAMLVFALAGISEASTSNLRIVNNTGYTIFYLYVSPSANSGWGSDLLGSCE